MDTWTIVALVLVAIVAGCLLIGRVSAHAKPAALDVSARPERSAEQFQRDFYPEVRPESIADIRAVLEAVARATGLPAGKLEPADELGAIAAANGLQRAFLIAHLGNEFPEAQGDMMRKTATGDFVYLHHAIAVVVNARLDARSRPVAA